MSNQLPNSKTQRSRILEVLLKARGEWVPLPEILRLNIAQYGTRVHELRGMGFHISNRIEHRDGKALSFFRLETGPAATVEKPTKAEPSGQPPLFDLERHRDDG